jgi:putative transcriptional regulator
VSSSRAEEGRPFSSIAGRLLIATPLLLDPNFYRAVVYIVEHSEEGALGVVLNRATEEPVTDHLPEWTDWLSDPPVVFVGGPVANEVAVGVIAKPEVLPDSWNPTPDGLGLVDLSEGPDGLGAVASARVYSGYSGWVAGQLEMELGSGSWIVVEGGLADVFTTDPDALWRKVLRRQPDRRSLYASFPDDPASN